MNHRETTERLPWYLAGSLDPGEAEEVRAHLEQCAECRAEVEATRLVARVNAAAHPASAELVDTAWDRLGGARRSVVEEHLRDCPECREELALIRESRLVGDATEGRSPGDGWRRFALAASLAAVLAGSGYVREVWGPEAAAPAVTLVELLPDSFAARGTSTEVERPREHRGSLVLVLVTDRVESFEEVRAVLRDAGGRELWRAEDLERSPSGDFGVRLPDEILGVGECFLTLDGTLDGRRTPIEEYRLDLGS